MGCEGILEAMNEAGFRPNTRLVFFVLQRLDYCKAGGKIAVAREWLRDKCGFATDMPVRNALRALAKAGWLSAIPQDKKYTVVKLLRHRLPIQETIQETIQQNSAKIQHKSKQPIQEPIQRTIHKDVDVSSVVIPAVNNTVFPSVSIDKRERRAEAREAPLSAPPEPTAQVKPDPTPHLDFERLYAELCPRLIHCREFTKQRQESLRAAWKKHPNLDYWRDVMTKANKSDFCSGVNDRGWRCDIEFIMRHHVHIGEGRYDNKPSRWAPPAGVSPSVRKPDPSPEELGTPTDAETHFGGFLRGVRQPIAVGSKPGHS